MGPANKKTIILLIGLVSILLLPGCTDWKKKYENLLVAHKNLQGRLEFEMKEKEKLASMVSEDQQTIKELQDTVAERNRTAAETGFGPGYEVARDASAGTITVTLPNAILFSPGEAALKKKTIAELDHIRSVLQSQYQGKQTDVVGHTDSDPIKKSKWKDNWELSTERALSVVRYLVERGMPKDRVRAIGRGDSQPIASNATVSGKARNRRVEIVVHVR